jgi:citrate lyase subunit beta/citryl-CoA lyase
LSWVSGVVLPKVESHRDVELFRRAAGDEIYLLAIIESPRGVVHVDEIAASKVNRLAFGSADYAAELGAAPSELLYEYPRSRLVVASSAAGLAAPVDGPTLSIADESQLLHDVEIAVALGMGGKFCIHPRQLPVVQSNFKVSSFDKKWADEILEAVEKNGDGVFTFRGEMVDAPVILRARKIRDGN